MSRQRMSVVCGFSDFRLFDDSLTKGTASSDGERQ